jgi:3D (Asp-Asp-Asp) domain-containing protein
LTVHKQWDKMSFYKGGETMNIREKLSAYYKKVQQLNHHRILFVSCLITACLLLTAFGLYTQQSVQLTVKLNGVEQDVVSQSKTVEQLLEELNIKYSTRDHIAPGLHSVLESDMIVTWNQANQVTINLYGEAKSVWTNALTVQDFFAEQGIPLRENDVVEPELSTNIKDINEVEVTHVRYETVKEEFTVGYQTIRKQDPAMLQGQEKKVAEGSDGKGAHQFNVTFTNGEESNRELVTTLVIEEAKNEVIAVGTKPSVSRGNYVFAPQRVLENVIVTAYAAGPDHTGKSPGDPHYGMTRSGTRATEGRTIAVDTNVIPMGTWVYIEGIGLRKAEDTGGAVKGKKIDVYYESDATAKKFGLKRGYTVYVIGKTKPSEQ